MAQSYFIGKTLGIKDQNMIATIPTLLLFLSMQKQFVAGMTGSIKY